MRQWRTSQLYSFILAQPPPLVKEAKGGCGFRRIGGLYLCGEHISAPCDRMPFPITTFPDWRYFPLLKLLAHACGNKTEGVVV